MLKCWKLQVSIVFNHIKQSIFLYSIKDVHILEILMFFIWANCEKDNNNFKKKQFSRHYC